ncbi:DUF1858 domain-containing protein [Candidatus Woesearchaeota archaeon]|nr:DUF1858 domain-containing protein [Candidatus Woesearchaeota archaeon]
MAEEKPAVEAEEKNEVKKDSEDDSIRRNMTIGEVVQRFPAAVEVLFEEGVHCVGCMASHFETIEQGLAGHGKEDSEIDEIVDRMNKAVIDNQEENGE